jgi:Conjugative transposon protein TcpC
MTGPAARRELRPTVTVVTRALWRIRLAQEFPRYLVSLLALMGLAASARFAISPPRPASAIVRSQPTATDPPAEAYATLFARRYLTWNAAEPVGFEQVLEPFVGVEMEQAAGVQLPARGEEHVEWAEVVQEREPLAGERVYTVAAQTDTAGLVYLTVPVLSRNGILALGGYPAFVGAPAAAPAAALAHLREVADPTLAIVVQRALRNYLAASPSELAADLADGAQVALPSVRLTLESVGHLDWAPGGGAVLATVAAQDGRGVRYTLAYELDVIREQGRWEISAIQTDPDE